MSLNMGRSGWEALAIRWVSGRVPPEEQEMLRAQMSRAEARQFHRLCEDAENKKIHHGDAFITGRQLAQHLGAYTDTMLIPLGHNLDVLTAKVEFLLLPFYKRWWFYLSNLFARLGVRVVKVEESEQQEDGAVGDALGRVEQDRHSDDTARPSPPSPAAPVPPEGGVTHIDKRSAR